MLQCAWNIYVTVCMCAEHTHKAFTNTWSRQDRIWHSQTPQVCCHISYWRETSCCLWTDLDTTLYWRSESRIQVWFTLAANHSGLYDVNTATSRTVTLLLNGQWNKYFISIFSDNMATFFIPAIIIQHLSIKKFLFLTIWNEHELCYSS
jgi:hypothetical protein